MEACQQACIFDPECKQYAYREGECTLAHCVRLGREEPGYKSGWITDRIQKWLDDSIQACEGMSEREMFRIRDEDEDEDEDVDD